MLRSMKIEIALFGKLAEPAGRHFEIVLPPDATIAAARAALAAACPAIAAELARPATRACVDQVMVPEDFAIPPGAAVAFLPPLSGG